MKVPADALLVLLVGLVLCWSAGGVRGFLAGLLAASIGFFIGRTR
jgi:hypothetical protein